MNFPGDKETFWLGWELSGDFKYSFHQGDAGTMGIINDTYSLNERSTFQTDASHQGAAGSDSNPEMPVLLDRDNYTICAPQLLHLDLDGKPLWFNGWILDNKFVDKTQKHFGDFESYVVEPHGWEGPDAWQLQHDNQCCLTTYPRLKFDFSKREKETLSMIIRRAAEVEALVLS